MSVPADRSLACVVMLFTILIAGILASVEVRAQSPPFSLEEVRGTGLEVYATVSGTVPRVTLRWNASHFPPTGLTVYRRMPGETGWGAGIVLDPGATSYADASAAANTLYEYRVVRTQDSGMAPVVEGHLWSGFEIPMVDSRGRLILVIDETMVQPLEAEIARLVEDLRGDGWVVARTDVARTTSPQMVWDAIHGRYSEDPANTRAVFLLGRVPVPYSGIVCPDGHWDPPPDPHHRGAWPTDAFYGDMDGAWGDNTVHYTTGNLDGSRHHNVPGDGKFDVSLLTGTHLPELAVGRVDLSNMGGVANGLTETELLRRYLDRHHSFRHRIGPFESLGNRALIDDDTFGPQWGTAFATGGWASGVALFGPANTSPGDWVPNLRDQDHLLAFGCGPGSFQGALGVSTNAEFRETRCRAVFNLLFGSFFGDWDSSDNYLRAPLVGRADSHGLVSVWAGIPRWQFFPLAAGGTMADAYHHTLLEVNQPGGPFPPADESWTNPDQSHVAIMGDPVLRLHPVKPVSALSAQVDRDEVEFNWSLPAGETEILGCRIYRAAEEGGPYLRVGAQTGAGATGFVDTVPNAGTWHYFVRVVKRQTTASASYENPSQGIRVAVEVPAYDYSFWSQGLPDSGANADPNGDGVTNLLAYALGADDGMGSAVHHLPHPGAPGSFVVPFSDREDVGYRVQLSPDLTTWFTVAIRPVGGTWSLNPSSGYPGQGGLAIGGGEDSVFSDPSSEGARFWRLRVDR